jgi:hypothetical protein
MTLACLLALGATVGDAERVLAILGARVVPESPEAILEELREALHSLTL